LFILICSDLLSNFLAYFFTFSEFNYLSGISYYLFVEKIVPVLVLQFIWSILFFFANLYDTRATLSRFDEIIRLFPMIYSSAVIFISLHIFGFINLDIDYKKILTYGLALSTFLTFNRFIIHTVQKYLLKKGVGLKNAIILGINRRSVAIYKNLIDQHYHGLKVVGFVHANGDPSSFNHENIDIKKLGNESELGKIIKSEKINDVIIALDMPKAERIMSAIVNINGSPVSIKILPDMYEVVTGLARTTQLVGVPLIDVNMNIDTFYSRVLKRTLDIILALAGIIILIPIWLIIGILIKVDSSGPIIYFQSRLGKNEKLFNILKFRSMIFNAESTTGPIWSDFKDERITRLGKILRRLHIDETPQLVNILKGDMSIVGPRPERPFFIKQLKKTYPFYGRRLRIRPGVTGWAQINQPFDTNIKDVHQKLKYDFYYIENLNLRLDFHIIFRTAWVVIRGHKN